MNNNVKQLIQKTFNRFGFQLRRVDNGVSYVDPYLEQARLLKNRQVKTIFEVGAADGRDCIKYAKIFPDSTVLAFEPVPKSFLKLQENVSIDKNKDRILLNNIALSNKSGEFEFYLSELTDASSLLESRSTGSTFDSYCKTVDKILVKANTIDIFCAENGISSIDLLKMDAQGAELMILQGAKKMLGSNSIGCIYTEISFMEIYKQGAIYYELAAFLKEFGFGLHSFYNLFTNQKGQLTWGDAIFVKSDS